MGLPVMRQFSRANSLCDHKRTDHTGRDSHLQFVLRTGVRRNAYSNGGFFLLVNPIPPEILLSS
jgi:hypothetical protein